ncbi:oligosaccharide flippase family protein [Anaerostipes butyraticus]|uniref:Flippase n=1 Tax=Anaerostipes butyraticus TaxID=645466 RepID=A0A916QAS9_9FIRM|nr:oligosaccharide flippase family protein [Anaerostipes butyraticus]GFO86206.1 flippase [Anaerostipes butyraticus]
MNNSRSQLRIGVILSYINLGISFIIPFAYTPVMLRMLGQSEYGLYSLANSVINYLTLLTFGFGSTVIRYLSKYRAENNKEGVQKTFGLFLSLYSIAALLVLVVGIIISFNVEGIFHRGLTGSEISKIYILVLIMTFNTALSFPLSVFSSVITSYERYLYRKVIDMFSTVAAPIFNLIALYLGFASVGMALTSTILQFIMLPLNMGYCFKVLKIVPKFGRIAPSLLREMLGFSFYAFIGTLVDLLFWSTDRVILGMFAGSISVAIYNVGASFNSIVMNLSTSISGVLTPKITGMVVTNAGTDQLTELFIRVGRLQYLIIALVISGFTVFGQSFIYFWAGAEYADSYWIAILTLFPLCIPLIQNTGLSIVTAQNKHKFRSITYLVVAILNVISTYIVVPFMGNIGAALCSGISYILGHGVIMNLYYYRVTRINIPLFWKNIGLLSFIPGGMMIIGLILKHYYLISSVSVFLISVIVYVGIYAVLMYIFCLNDYEKSIIKGPLQKVIGVLRKRK